MKKILIALILFVSIIGFAQQKYQSLLWEITGNGLEKPSYLYGTMHVSKKVAFRLDDVFYKALKESECIALESDPTTWPGFNYDMMLNEIAFYNNYRNEFYTNLFKLTHPEEMAIRGSVRMDNGAVNAYLYRKNNAADNFEEETYLDMFIYQAGKKNGKEIYGLEDLAESRYLTTKAAYNANKKDLDPWIQKLYAKENPYLIQENLYRDRNLDLLDSIGAGVNTEFYRENMLYIRNENMVNSLVELMPKKSVFAGVGAAHLPGNKGMINMLRQKGYKVKALTSKQTDFSKTEKTKLDSLFVEPELKMHKTPDGFLSLNTYDELREFSYAGQKYYLDPDMTNGAYLTVNRISRFMYLPNEKENITLKDIDDLLYEDIPGDIIKKETLTEPYPGLSIVNKTKKGEFQKYHMYQTPLEIIIIKFAGRSDFVLQHEAKIFNSIALKTPSNSSKMFIAPNKKFEVNFPEYFITSNMQNGGKKLLEGYKNDSYYFMEEAALHDIDYIEEDSFEAKYFHHALYKDYKLKEVKGGFKRGTYKNYESHAVLDTTTGKKLYLKTIVKDASYYLLGYVGTDDTEKTNFFKSFKFNKTHYEDFEKVVDTSLHFSVQTNAKPPVPNPYGYGSYNNNKEAKDYVEKSKSTTYSTKANEQISISRKKFHDLQMFHNVDSLWKDVDRKINFTTRYYMPEEKFKISNRTTSKTDDTYVYNFTYTDSVSAKQVMVKNVLKQGVLFELKTLIDSISGPSKFVTEFYDSFTPIDTLMGKSVLEDKTKQFFEALRANDSIVLESYNLIKFKKHNSKDIVSVLKDFEFEKERLNIKSHLVEQLIEIDLKNNLEFIKRLYYDSYSDPQTQTSILEGLFDSNKKENFALAMDLMERDLPLGGIGGIFYNYYRKDSLPLKASLFPKILQYSTISEYKQPVYDLLARVKDSGLIKMRTYSKYKNQIINDGKIEVKRSLSNNGYGYNSYSDDLSTYVNLIFPYRKERTAQDFFDKMLNVENKSALVRYYILLSKNKENIPTELKKKLIDDEENLYFLLEKLDDEKLHKTIKSLNISQQQYAKSKLLSNANYEKEKDSITFLLKRDFKTDKGKTAVMYFFKMDKDDEYSGKSEVLHYISFIKPKDPKQLVVDFYSKSENYGTTVDETKELEEQYEEIINLAIYKDRKRVTPSARNGYNGYNDY
ncbi:TraB/GumN family protein [Winogradskyella flava]|uniref:TraB/GumN family protein n=1 Tax=Winogradskyella flava TaxID=1884876 RepID=UPI0024927B74|nr:TraB/GumN family protein [Winogradskyella flava]